MLQFTAATAAIASVVTATASAADAVSCLLQTKYNIQSTIIYWKIYDYIENNFLLVKWTTIR